MVEVPDNSVLTVDSFNEIPGVVHGFGKKFFGEEKLFKIVIFRDFRLIKLKQVHSDIIHFLNNVPEKMPVGDALITNQPNLLLGVKTADCLPVLLAHSERKVVAAVHCGWRSTAKKILKKVTKAMIVKYHCNSSSLRVAMGPCIEKECFQVGKDVYDIFKKAGFPQDIFEEDISFPGKWLLDLRKANRIQLLEEGVLPSHIDSINLCTKCRRELASYRREGKESGRMLSIIGIY